MFGCHLVRTLLLFPWSDDKLRFVVWQCSNIQIVRLFVVQRSPSPTANRPNTITAYIITKPASISNHSTLSLDPRMIAVYDAGHREPLTSTTSGLALLIDSPHANSASAAFRRDATTLVMPLWTVREAEQLYAIRGTHTQVHIEQQQATTAADAAAESSRRFRFDVLVSVFGYNPRLLFSSFTDCSDAELKEHARAQLQYVVYTITTAKQLINMVNSIALGTGHLATSHYLIHLDSRGPRHSRATPVWASPLARDMLLNRVLSHERHAIDVWLTASHGLGPLACYHA